MHSKTLNLPRDSYYVDTVTDFLIELGMKPLMYLVEISLFSLNTVTFRRTKIGHIVRK